MAHAKESPQALQPVASLKRTLSSDPTYRFKLDETSLLKARQYLLTTIGKNAEQLVTLTKGRYARELKIPGTEVAVDESQVRTFYPIGLSALLLIIVFRYRNPLLRRINQDQSQVPPVWAAPLAYGRYQLNFWQCSLLNLAWLSVVAFVVRLFLNASVRREFYTTAALYTANLVAGALFAGTYLSLFILAILNSKRRESTS